jgi:hypothetical protein
MEGLGTEEGNKGPVTFLELQTLSLLSFSQTTGISEGCNKDVKLASTEPNGLLLPAGLWHQRI